MLTEEEKYLLNLLHSKDGEEKLKSVLKELGLLDASPLRETSTT